MHAPIFFHFISTVAVWYWELSDTLSCNRCLSKVCTCKYMGRGIVRHVWEDDDTESIVRITYSWTVMLLKLHAQRNDQKWVDLCFIWVDRLTSWISCVTQAALCYLDEHENSKHLKQVQKLYRLQNNFKGWPYRNASILYAGAWFYFNVSFEVMSWVYFSLLTNSSTSLTFEAFLALCIGRRREKQVCRCSHVI